MKMIGTLVTVGVIAVALLAFAFFVGMRKAGLPEGEGEGVAVTDSEVAILANQIDALTEEMIDEILAEMDEYSVGLEDDMAGDYGMFLYQ